MAAAQVSIMIETTAVARASKMWWGLSDSSLSARTKRHRARQFVCNSGLFTFVNACCRTTAWNQIGLYCMLHRFVCASVACVDVSTERKMYFLVLSVTMDGLESSVGSDVTRIVNVCPLRQRV